MGTYQRIPQKQPDPSLYRKLSQSRPTRGLVHTHRMPGYDRMTTVVHEMEGPFAVLVPNYTGVDYVSFVPRRL